MKSFVLRLIKILAFLAIIAGSLAIMMFLPAKGFYKQGSRMLPDLGFMGTVLLVVSIILFIVGIFGFMAVLPNPKEGGDRRKARVGLRCFYRPGDDVCGIPVLLQY